MKVAQTEPVVEVVVKEPAQIVLAMSLEEATQLCAIISKVCGVGKLAPLVDSIYRPLNDIVGPEAFHDVVRKHITTPMKVR